MRVVVPPARPEVGADDELDFQARAVRQGQKAKALALETLERCGFRRIESGVNYASLGVEVNFRARDRRGRVWLFDVSGAFSSTRPGLKRTDTLWKALGKAGVLREARRRRDRPKDLDPLVLLSTDMPQRNSAGARALGVVCGTGGPDAMVFDVVELLDPAGLGRLAAYAAGDVAPR